MDEIKGFAIILYSMSILLVFGREIIQIRWEDLPDTAKSSVVGAPIPSGNLRVSVIGRPDAGSDVDLDLMLVVSGNDSY